MRNVSKVLALVTGLVLAGSTAAWADGYRSWRLCGGDTFMTCAAVEVSVTGTSVTMRVWNLSGNGMATAGVGYGAPAGTIINGIGFYNTNSPGVITSSLSTFGPARPGDTPGSWNLKNIGSVAFSVDFRTASSRNVGGIASACATAAELPGTPPNLYMNPCQGDITNPANYVTFTFTLANGQTWDPSTTDISIRGYDGLTGNTTECWTGQIGVSPPNCFTVAPEPVTMTLLATGLAGMGGVGLIRRRRNRTTVE